MNTSPKMQGLDPILTQTHWPVVVCVWTAQALARVFEAAHIVPNARRLQRHGKWFVATPRVDNIGGAVSGEYYGAKVQAWLIYNAQNESILMDGGVVDFFESMPKRDTLVIALNPPPRDAGALAVRPDLVKLCVQNGTQSPDAMFVLGLLCVAGAPQLIKDTQTDALVAPAEMFDFDLPDAEEMDEFFA